MEIPGRQVRGLSGNLSFRRRFHDQVNECRRQQKSEKAQKTEEERDDGVHGRPPFMGLFGGSPKKLKTMTKIMVRRKIEGDNFSEFNMNALTGSRAWKGGLSFQIGNRGGAGGRALAGENEEDT